MLRIKLQSKSPVAVILAAGLGSRLRAVHAVRPKGFVEIDGRPIIARSVEALKQAGVREFVFVVGWLGGVYRDWCAEVCPEAICVENADYATTGSLKSLVLGCAAVAGRDVCVVESDLLYEQRAPLLLMQSDAADTVLISDFTQSGDEVWAYGGQAGDPARLAHLGKQRLAGRGPDGELVGLSRFSASLVAALAEAERGLPAGAHYEDGLNAVCAARPVTLLRASGLAWCEIDDAAHLERARSKIWPRILGLDTAASFRS